MITKQNNKDLIFFWVPKNAGTSFIQNRCAALYCDWEEMKSNHFNSGWRTFGHYYVPDLVANNVIDKDYYNRALKIAIKRNPYDRAISLWKYYWSQLTFVDFLKYIKKSGFVKPGLFNVAGPGPGLARWSMCSNQIDWLVDDMDHIIGFENIKENFSNLFGCGIINHCNKTGVRETSEYRCFYDDETKKLVEELYEPDLTRYSEYQF